MSDPAWAEGTSVTVTVYLDGRAIPFPDPSGRPVIGDSFLMMFNAWWNSLAMTIPPTLEGPWTLELDGSQPAGEPPPRGEITPGTKLGVPPRSFLMLRQSH